MEKARSFVTATLAALAAVGTLLGVAYVGLVPSEDAALTVFWDYGKTPGQAVTEEMQVDPLIVARGDVVPIVLREVANPSMPKRRYALAFLGNSGRREAIPYLEKIVVNEREDVLFRGDALDAIALIDLERARVLASALVAREDYLGNCAESVMNGVLRQRRSRAKALRSFICVRLTGC